MTEPDFIIRDEGSIILFSPRSERAQDWWNDCVDFEDWQKLNQFFAVDHRMARAIFIGIEHDGFVARVEE